MQRSFLHGAFVLMAAALVTRIMGFVYNIFITRLIGAEGLGLFRLVFPILSLVLTLITAGLPVAISKLVAEALVQQDAVRIRRILRVSIGVISTMAIVFTFLMWVSRGFIKTHWLSDPRAYPTYLAMIPIAAVISVSVIYRGYFQGIQYMTPPAWASILEQTVRIISIWIMASRMIRYGLAYAAAAAMVGMLLGEITGLIVLAISHHRRARLRIILPDAPLRSLEETKQTLKSIAQIAVPVTFSRLVGTAMYALEPVLVTRSLMLAGATTAMTTMYYGQYSGMAWPLLAFPAVFTGSLATNLVPSVSEAAAGGNKARIRVRLVQSWRAAALVGFPSMVILTMFAEPLCRFIYHQNHVGPILAIMAPTGFFIYLQSPLSGILQGLNRAGLAMMNSIIGGIVRLTLIYLLASQPHLGIYGVAWASTIANCVTTGLYLFCVYRLVGFPISVEDTSKMGVAALLMLIWMAWMARHGVVSGWHLCVIVLSGLFIYIVLCCSFRVLTTRMVRRIPRIGPVLASFVSHIPFAV